MKLDPQLLEFAKTMRHNATDAENLMWQLLRAKRFMNLKFRRQHVIKPYIVDFYCHEIGLVIELDGRQSGIVHKNNMIKLLIFLSNNLKSSKLLMAN